MENLLCRTVIISLPYFNLYITGEKYLKHHTRFVITKTDLFKHFSRIWLYDANEESLLLCELLKQKKERLRV